MYSRGFVPIIVVIIVTVLLAGGAGVYFAVSPKEPPGRGPGYSAPAPEPKPEPQAQVDPAPRDVEQIPSSSAQMIAPPSKPAEEKKAKSSSIEIKKPEAPLSLHTPSPPPAEAQIPSQSTKLTNLEREITILFNNAHAISPEHYARLKSELDAEAAAGVDPQKIQKLREMLLTVNPDNVSSTASPTPAPQACSDDLKPQLVADITEFAKIQKITAPGSTSYEGPKGHSFVWTNHARVPVYMPITAVFDTGSYGKDNAESPAQYALSFTVKENCNYNFKFDHIDEPIEAIRRQLPQTPTVADSRGIEVAEKIEFKAGDLVGYTNGTRQAGNWDFGLYYMKEIGILGTQYGSYGRHGNAVCWVDFYAPPKQDLYRRLLEGPKLLCSF